jgi:hypothetical protein
MRAVRFGFLFLITMVLIRLLTLVTYFYPDIYWISPLYALMELLLNLNLDNLASILVYIIYPSLFYVPWLIIYIFILLSNSNRYSGKLRFVIFSILGVMGVISSTVMNYIILILNSSGEYSYSLLLPINNIAGLISIAFLIVILILPNTRYVIYYKLLRVGSFIMSYVFGIFIIPLLIYNSQDSGLILIESSSLFFDLVNILAFYCLMKYMESEKSEEFISNKI